MKRFLWRHKALFVIWTIVIGVGLYGGYLLFFKSSGNQNPYVRSNESGSSAKLAQPEEESQQTELQQIKVGETTLDGDLEFTVTGVDCKGRTVGTNQYAMDEAEGQFCRLTTQVKNIGTKATSLPLDAQQLFTPTGEAHKPDMQATQYAQEDQTAGYWYEDIAPNAVVTGELVFDISGGRVSRVILHGAKGTPGIQVALE